MIVHDFGVPHHRGGCWGQGGGDPQGVYPILEGGDMIRVRVVGAPERLIEAPGPADAPGLEFWVTDCCSGRARARFLEI